MQAIITKTKEELLAAVSKARDNKKLPSYLPVNVTIVDEDADLIFSAIITRNARFNSDCKLTANLYGNIVYGRKKGKGNTESNSSNYRTEAEFDKAIENIFSKIAANKKYLVQRAIK